MNEEELTALNHRIVERLKFLDSVRTHSDMMEFSLGEKVCFDSPGQGMQLGVLTKFNKKTVTIITETGTRWNVSPHFLSKVKNEKVIQLETIGELSTSNDNNNKI